MKFRQLSSPEGPARCKQCPNRAYVCSCILHPDYLKQKTIKGTSKYPGNAVTAIREACNQDLMACETEYFKFKFFFNGNCHIQFKRMDLVARMNQIAGENLVKPVH